MFKTALWTSCEIALLKQIYPNTPNERLCDLIPGKTQYAIYKKARRIGLKREASVEWHNRSAGRKNIPHKDIVVTRRGYKMVYLPDHPRADKSGRVMEHIVVWETEHNSTVPAGYVVHHINFDKGDNRPENLLLLTTGEHTKLHNSLRTVSEETKEKIRAKSIARLSDERNHPMYKNIDICKLQREVANGETIKSVCAKHGINKTTYYKKLKRSVDL